MRHFKSLFVVLVFLLTDAVAGQYHQLPSDGQRVTILDQMGGLVTFATPLPDGTMLMAEGEAIVRLRMPEDHTEIIARQNLGYGMLLAIVGDYPTFYVLSEQGLLTLKMAGGDLPDVIDVIPGGGQSIVKKGRIIAVATREAGIKLFQTDDEGLLHHAASVDLNSTISEVAFSPDGNYLYAAAGDQGVHVIQISDPLAPSLTDTFTDPNPAESVESVEELLAVGSQGQVVLLDPVTGLAIGSYNPMRDGQRITADGEGYAYVADGSDGLKIFYLAAPDRPVQVYGEMAHPAYDVLYQNERIYLVGVGGLRVFDVSSRYRPLLIAQLDLPGVPQGVTLGPGKIYVALGSEGVGVIDANTMTLQRKIPVESDAYAVVYDRERVYVAAGDSGLVIIAATGGGDVLESTLELPGPALDITRRGRALYLTVGEAGLVSVDINDPVKPVIVGTLGASEGRAYTSIHIEGSRGYISFGDGFIVADINYPDSMGHLARVNAPASHIVRQGIYLYVVSGRGIRVYDAWATANPVWLRTYLAPTAIRGMVAAGERLFLTHDGTGPEVVVLGVGTPDFPIELDNVGADGHSFQVYPSQNNVWIAQGYGGLTQYGLTEGGALLRKSSYLALPEIAHVEIENGQVVVGGRAGWMVANSSLGGSDVVRDIAVHEGLIAIAAGEDGIALYANNGELYARRPTDGPATAIDADKDFIYVVVPAGLAVYDRIHLQPVLTIPTPVMPRDVRVQGQTALLALGDQGIGMATLDGLSDGMTIQSTIKTRRPGQLILGPDRKAIYWLSGDNVARLRISDGDQIVIDEEAKFDSPAEDGVFVGTLMAAFSAGNNVTLYDLSALNVGAFSRGEIDITRGELTGTQIIANGPVVYVIYGEEGLGLIDIKGTGERVMFLQEPVDSMLLHDGILFTAGGTLIRAWDVSQPGNPVEIASGELYAPVMRVDPGHGSTLLLNHSIGISVIDWDGTGFKPQTFIALPGAAKQTVQIGDRAYVALRRGGLMVVDMEEEKGLFSYTSPAGQIVSDMLHLGNNLLLVSWEEGIDVVDVGVDPSFPHLQETLSLNGQEVIAIQPSDDGQIAAALGDDGAAILNMNDAGQIEVTGYVDTVGDGLSATVTGSTLLVADGVCGLRIFDTANTTEIEEAGYWQGQFASDVMIEDDVIYVADGNRLVTLKYDPLLPGIAPPAAQFPIPPDGTNDESFSVDLAWGPPPDRCHPLAYNVYFGQSENPPLMAEVVGDPFIEMGDLSPARTYYWRVDTIDRQGDVTTGATWHFTTAPVNFADMLPAAPPLFEKVVGENRGIPLALAGIALISITWFVIRRAQNLEQDQDNIPAWYTAEDLYDD